MNAPLGENPQDLTGRHVVDTEGNKVGSVQQIYRDDATNAPEWITVRTGLFGMKETFVPLAGARRVNDEIQVPYAKDKIKDAPRIDADGHLEPSEERELYRHYGMTRPGTAAAGTAPLGRTGTASPDRTRMTGHAPLAGAGAGAGMAMARGQAGATERGVEQNPEMTLSEEHLRVGTEEHESGRARLVKHVVTDEVTRTVPVSHEEARLVREKISEEDRRRGRTAPRIGEGEVEVVLHEEEAVVSKETVPVERVRLETERVTENREVTAEVSKEQAEFDDGTGKRRRTRGHQGERRRGPGPEWQR
ncbi:PRC and DUF2382 domain-containing protein [Streptomyces sp. MST-110588]|uniref:PRC and DUF2382 domain-containing protein n=1 Tax=Streptomyces sp. MST-110588 TaxID=2833628 RepID=UPI001F5C9481|nr:PRC and DUF2382 domain-containing protein [Streptomyces sp. MST-110588]UNO39773.1 PRC and DUF2382 domain-containing protein [Streptomyces sp. MST-110588]